jgi:hypothetical protein
VKPGSTDRVSDIHFPSSAGIADKSETIQIGILKGVCGNYPYMTHKTHGDSG